MHRLHHILLSFGNNLLGKHWLSLGDKKYTHIQPFIPLQQVKFRFTDRIHDEYIQYPIA